MLGFSNSEGLQLGMVRVWVRNKYCYYSNLMIVTQRQLPSS